MNHKIALILASLMITPSIWSMGTNYQQPKPTDTLRDRRSAKVPPLKAMPIKTCFSTGSTPRTPTLSPSVQSNREGKPSFVKAPPSSPATQQDKEEAKQATEESSSNQQISVLERGQDLRLETLALVCFANRCERIKKNALLAAILRPLLEQEPQLVNTILEYNDEEHKE